MKQTGTQNTDIQLTQLSKLPLPRILTVPKNFKCEIARHMYSKQLVTLHDTEDDV
jgi:phage gp36-like protein